MHRRTPAWRAHGVCKQSFGSCRTQAIAWGLAEQRGAVLKQVTANIQQVYATAGISGVRRLLVDQIKNPEMEFDALLKMAFFRAILYGAAGRLDEACDCLDQAIASRDPALVHLAVAPDWDSMRRDPRFATRLRSMALPSPPRNTSASKPALARRPRLFRALRIAYRARLSSAHARAGEQSGLRAMARYLDNAGRRGGAPGGGGRRRRARSART
jgi:hypothetical protein